MWEKEFFQVYKIFTFILSFELSKRTLNVLTQSHITWGWVGESDKATQLLIAWKVVLNALSGDGGDFKTSLLLWKGSDKTGFLLEGHSEWPDWELRRAGSFQFESVSGAFESFFNHGALEQSTLSNWQVSFHTPLSLFSSQNCVLLVKPIF